MIDSPSPTTVLPPPLRVVRKGLFVNRELTLGEAEALALHRAAELVGLPSQAEYLFQAECNRYWRRRQEAGDSLAPRTRAALDARDA